MIPQGMIPVDSDFARCIGFTSDKFLPHSYLWGKGDTVIVSFIHAKEPRTGAFRDIVKNIEKLKLAVEIPTPSDRMIEIGKKQGWRVFKTYGATYGEELYVLTNRKKAKT